MNTVYDLKTTLMDKKSISVKVFAQDTLKKFDLRLHSDEVGLLKNITDRNLNRPGLALAGFVDLFAHTRIQVFGNTEMRYLNSLTSKKRYTALEKIFTLDVPCIIVTDSNIPQTELLELSKKYNTAVFGTHMSTTKLSYLLTDYLDDCFALSSTLHASFVDVYGIGLLFIGDSGIGKSEIALDLIERGHRLVADDVVIATKKGEGILMGACPEINKHFMEIRGLGFIDIKEMFGVRAVRYQKRIEVVVGLTVATKENYVDAKRTGLNDDEFMRILDVEIPYIKLHLLPGKNITVISEIIALNYLLKHYGYNPAEVLAARQKVIIEAKKQGLNLKNNPTFEHDYE